MIVWNGWGFVVGIIAIVCLIGVQTLSGDAWGPTMQAASMLLAGGLTFGFDRFVLARKTGKTLIDPETGQEVVINNSHSLFFIPVKYWTFIFIAFAIAALVMGR